MSDVLDEAPPEVEKYSGKEWNEIPTDALLKLRDFHAKCAEKLYPVMAKEHRAIVREIDEELARRKIPMEKKGEAMEAYFKNLLRSVLKEAVRRGIIKRDQKVEELIES
ncbi:hypothetical protein J7L97_05900 [Candidatus Bathyarchaeota archaeon]|nr:hypothetical protein [Candidatus Bathyarchaeota archaeon]